MGWRWTPSSPPRSHLRFSSTTLSYLLCLPIGARRTAHTLCHATASADVTSCRPGTCGPRRYSVSIRRVSVRSAPAREGPQHTARSLGRPSRPWRMLLLEESALLQIFPGHVSLAVALVVGRLEVLLEGAEAVFLALLGGEHERMSLSRAGTHGPSAAPTAEQAQRGNAPPCAPHAPPSPPCQRLP